MSCPCYPNVCHCVPRCSEDCPEVIDYSFENINLSGVGVLEGVTNSTVQFRGVRSTNGNITVALNNTFHTIDLTLSDASLHGTTTFANDAARANATPEFEGQFGAQLNTDTAWLADGVAAGDWTQILTEGAITFQSGQSVNWTFNGTSSLTYSMTGSGSLTLGLASSAALNVQNSGSGDVTINNNGGGDFVVSAGVSKFMDNVELNARLDFLTTARLYVESNVVPALSVITTTSTPGKISSGLLSTFVSTVNTITYGVPTGTLTRTTFATGSVTLPQLAERVAALIVDLQATLKPSA